MNPRDIESKYVICFLRCDLNMTHSKSKYKVLEKKKKKRSRNKHVRETLG